MHTKGDVERCFQRSQVLLMLSKNIEDITQWREDMNFTFERQKNILRANAASE